MAEYAPVNPLEGFSLIDALRAAGRRAGRYGEAVARDIAAGYGDLVGLGKEALKGTTGRDPFVEDLRRQQAQAKVRQLRTGGDERASLTEAPFAQASNEPDVKLGSMVLDPANAIGTGLGTKLAMATVLKGGGKRGGKKVAEDVAEKVAPKVEEARAGYEVTKPTAPPPGMPIPEDEAEAVIETLRKPKPPRAELGLHESTTPGRIVNRTMANQGYTVNLPTGQTPSSGVMVGKYRNDDPRNIVVDALRRADVQRMAETNAEVLARPEHYLGTWHDTEGGKTYLDVSRRFTGNDDPALALRQATKTGERTEQKTVYDLNEPNPDARVKPVGNWEQFVKGEGDYGDEFGARMRELRGEGHEYMSQFPQDEWWGTPNLERVYGKERMPQMSGFIASTAPNQLLRPNVQQATEYGRRLIKGEPIIQPEWRAGPGEMTWKEGSMIGMEEGRANNLRKSAAGQLDQLSADKVREEAAAMMGDPNAAPLDRYWARVAEEPSKGVYTAMKEGTVEPGKQYATLKARIAQSAEEHGEPLRQHSALIWTGIRERIRKLGDLYGTKFRAGAAGESKSYDDHFMDLVREKAQHLGISVEEMERRLGAGDATLLSFIAASPLLAPIMEEVLGAQEQGGT